MTHASKRGNAMSEFILIESDSNSAESLDSREELALALIEPLLADGELHVSVASNGDGSLCVELM